MSDVVIRAEGLGKKYVIGQQGESERYTSLRDVVVRGARGFVRSARDLVGGKLPLGSGETTEDFWALKDVNFEIKRGEVVGIIGRNGAGKSTLLKILSRITEPTEGSVEIRGRVASLLEVGTGLHPELTGRENIYLNGAILGMLRAEIRRKFDEIVAFAEVEKFLDTPVKRYSSGMYVRLAFAVAAHLEPEILVIDEVLAVGDAEFQKKCLGKMGEVAEQGRTVLFVSHNLGAVRALCSRGIVLFDGSISSDSFIDDAIKMYLSDTVPSSKIKLASKQQSVYLKEVSAKYNQRSTQEDACIIINLKIRSKEYRRASIDIRLKDNFGANIAFSSLGLFKDSEQINLTIGDNFASLKIDAGYLASGIYTISIDIAEPFVQFLHRVEDCIKIEVHSVGCVDHSRILMQSWGYGSLHLPVFDLAGSSSSLPPPNLMG